MKDTYLTAKLVSPNMIRLAVFTGLPFNHPSVDLIMDGEIIKRLLPSRVSSLQSLTIADYRTPTDLELGHSYYLAIPGFGLAPLDVTEATTFEGFDEKYRYDGELGAIYSKGNTIFRVWAPLASKVNVLCRKNEDDEYAVYPMKRLPSGVYEAKIGKNLDLYRYVYEIVNNENLIRSSDPYAKASTMNGEESVVVDFSKLQVDFHRDSLPILNCPTESIIYECHVRDMTIAPNTDIVHKGTFKGLCEKGRRTQKGNPAGFDYIRSLGITHIQLLPIYDYKSVDESDPSKNYNWGYDPQQYFVPEGSYASEREDPLSRIKDLKEMVVAYHEAGIRVVMDVVYNHVYEYQSSVFEKVVPNYYFRKRANGMMANTSGCGDDLASERPMVRKMIVDACDHWIKEYGIDGFRFDLMGIIDIDTLLMIEAHAKAKDPSFLLYGEGWNMGGEVRVPLGHMGNFQHLPHFAFFNDHFREDAKKYLIGDMGAYAGFKHAYVSSSLHFIFPAKFLDATQTINYIECHDNATFFDYVDRCHPDYSMEEKLRICVLGYQTVLYSFGIPLIHMGQEIGQSKWGDENTYNKGDRFNKFSYSCLDERTWMYEEFKKTVAFRKSHRFFKVYDPRAIDNLIDISDVGCAMKVTFLNEASIAPAHSLTIYINPTMVNYDISDKVDGNVTKIRTLPSLSSFIVEE
ncbi:MAG: type I pullulanase [Bacilli bacterium]|nr:type I pullulanase [Bacilli bacterium]